MGFLSCLACSSSGNKDNEDTLSQHVGGENNAKLGGVPDRKAVRSERSTESVKDAENGTSQGNNAADSNTPANRDLGTYLQITDQSIDEAASRQTSNSKFMTDGYEAPQPNDQESEFYSAEEDGDKVITSHIDVRIPEQFSL